MAEEQNPAAAAGPPEPRRASTAEMVERIKAEELKALIVSPAVKIVPKEPPYGR